MTDKITGLKPGQTYNIQVAIVDDGEPFVVSCEEYDEDNPQHQRAMEPIEASDE